MNKMIRSPDGTRVIGCYCGWLFPKIIEVSTIQEHEKVDISVSIECPGCGSEYKLSGRYLRREVYEVIA